jgi:sRNA-binding regulator protein Hfq
MYEQYGKMKEPRRYKNREQEDTIGFFDMLNGKHIEAHLITGEVIEGILETNAYNKYDVLLRNDEGMYVVPKAAIEYVRAIPDTKEVKRND